MASPSASSEQSSDDELWSWLSPHEARWKERQPFLESKGYMLRPRYQPDWTPAWRGTGKDPLLFEDSISLPSREHLIDAKRISDASLVYIKRVRTGDNESRIATMLSAEPHCNDPRNHSVPVLDLFQDSDNPEISYMVMPFLRLVDRPEFDIVDDVIGFATQILEGLLFLHDRGVAHRDCSERNLMMDAREMYPHGFHPVNDRFLPDARTVARPIPRSEVSVKYYYVDFGISVYIPPDVQPKLALGDLGRDREVPELSTRVPYDPFKVDIFIIGNVFRRVFYNKFSNLGFLLPLIQAMTQHEPTLRPSASEALQQWQNIEKTLSNSHRRWRLRPRRENWLEMAVLDTASLCRTIFRLTAGLFTFGIDIQG